MKKSTSLIALASLLLAALTACGVPVAPQPESDSPQGYAYVAGGVPVDTSVYTIKGQVVGAVESLVRQTQAAGGSVGGAAVGGYGWMSGTFWGAEFGGKGFVRLKVIESDTNSAPGEDLAPLESIIILKTTDTKMRALLPGDIVTVQCRRQFEAIAPVLKNEEFDPSKGMWELDYCRMVSPRIEVTGDVLGEK